MQACILVVEDEPDLVMLLRDVLEDEGFNVASAEHPDEALKLSTRIHPDLYLVDLMLPAITGIELARHINTRGAPMLAMSASIPMLKAAQESGLFHGTITKPFDLNALVDCIRTTLGDRSVDS